MVKQWYGASWANGEKLLWCEIEKGEKKSIDDALNFEGCSVITLTTGGQGFGGLFDAIDESEMWKRNELLRWAKEKNRKENHYVWTEADEETLETIREYHENSCVITALVLCMRNRNGGWENDVLADIVLKRMRDWNERKRCAK